MTVNGTVPAPLLRLREGENVRISVENRLDEETSIHWHGFILPFQMDRVPGISFPGIRPRETFVYEFPIVQNGTYWYHSHSGLQEQQGHYGPIVIDPAGRDPSNMIASTSSSSRTGASSTPTGSWRSSSRRPATSIASG